MNETEMKVVSVPINEVYSDDEFNCRGRVVPFDVIDLAQDIEKNGLLQPITVQPWIKHPPYKYRVVAGHRRLQACKVNKMEKIPSIIREGLSDVQVRVINLQENIQRKDLNLLQEAHAIEKFKNAGYTQQEVADMLKVSIGWVQVRFTLLGLEPEVQQAAAAGFLSQEQVKEVASVPKDKRFEVVKIIKEAKLRGEKRKVKIKDKRISLTAKRARRREEIFEMLEFVIDNLEAGLHTRCMSWCAGEISTLELYHDFQEYAKERGIPFALPHDVMMTGMV